MKCKLINSNITKDYVKTLLSERGVEDFSCFVAPSDMELQTPFALDNIDNGVKLLAQVLAKPNPSIAIIVDCDVDGFTSAAIIYQYIQRLNAEVELMGLIHDGKQHGLEDKISFFLETDKHFDLLIMPDAGSNDFKYIENLKEINLPVLILDHHIVEDDTPLSDNCCIINNQASPAYHNKHLSGAGVVYQFCRALDAFYNVNFANDYIDLAALGICADMMSGLESENQYFWRNGFKKINNLFFMSIARKQGYSITGTYNPSDAEIIDALNPMTVAFYIVPMINAMIRVGSAAEKERLFYAFVDGERMVPCNKRGAKGTYEKVAIESVRECVNARTHQNKIKEDVIERIEQKIFKYDLLENKILFIRLDEDDTFPPELNGLVAMGLSTKYKRPTIVARLNDEGFIRGSARGLNASELASFKDYLNSTNLFEYTMGHDNAFGISISNKNLAAFHQIANTELASYDFGEDYHEVNFERIAMAPDLGALINDIGAHDFIWSQQNEAPKIHITDINLTKQDIQIIGKTGNTLRFEKNGVTYIQFFANELIEKLQNYNDIKMEVVGVAKLNVWGGRVTRQIIIKDYEIKDGKCEF